MKFRLRCPFRSHSSSVSFALVVWYADWPSYMTYNGFHRINHTISLFVTEMAIPMSTGLKRPRPLNHHLNSHRLNPNQETLRCLVFSVGYTRTVWGNFCGLSIVFTLCNATRHRKQFTLNMDVCHEATTRRCRPSVNRRFCKSENRGAAAPHNR